MSDRETDNQNELMAYYNYLSDWQKSLETPSLDAVIAEAGGPQHVGIFCVDLIQGFCFEGPLQSPRIAAIVPAIRSLFVRAYDLGVRHYVLTMDNHTPEAAEFAFYPPHCIAGTSESELVPELNALPFSADFVKLPKNSISSSIGTGLDAWLEKHSEVTHRIVVGDCTDLCTYQLAMHLQLSSLARDMRQPVIVPVNCVDTYDVPVNAAREAGITPHPAVALHPLFLHQMAANGVRAVASLK